MGKYTLTIQEIVEEKIPIFDFDYDIFDKDYKKILEEKIINHYYFYEIGMETIGAFKFKLREKMNLIFPTMNKYYESELLEQRILDNYDITETYKKTSQGESETTSNGNRKNKSKLMDTPQSRVDIPSNGSISSISEDEGTNTDNLLNVGSGVEEWERRMIGNIGVQTDADAVNKFRTSILNVDKMVIDELKDLFMGVW